MGLFDDLEGDVKNALNDPAHRAKIEEIARSRGMSLEQAAQHYVTHRKS
jgi:cell division protein FtsL